jgi:hypothetical protein
MRSTWQIGLSMPACARGSSSKPSESWPKICMRPGSIAAKRIGDAEAVGQLAGRPEFADILGATPYALRRGGISLRLRAEDPLTVAKECGTSLKMLSAHYAFAIDDLRRFGPRPIDVEWRAARAAQAGNEPRRRRLRAARDREDGRRRRKVFARFAAGRRGRGVS